MWVNFGTGLRFRAGRNLLYAVWGIRCIYCLLSLGFLAVGSATTKEFIIPRKHRSGRTMLQPLNICTVITQTSAFTGLHLKELLLNYVNMKIMYAFV
jgi:hypothetical protein